MQKRKRIFRALCLGLSMVFLPSLPWGAGAASGNKESRIAEEPPAIARPAGRMRLYLFGRAEAPEFVLRELSGEEMRLSDFRGKVVLVNFWTTW